ncbi:unnamed protein product [Camellia sinensis]
MLTTQRSLMCTMWGACIQSTEPISVPLSQMLESINVINPWGAMQIGNYLGSPLLFLSYCGKKYNMGGPIWSAPIHDQELVTSILADVKSIKDRCSSVMLKCTSPSAVIFRCAVINAGHRISGTHVNLLGLKSDAPMDVIWDAMRCW